MDRTLHATTDGSPPRASTDSRRLGPVDPQRSACSAPAPIRPPIDPAIPEALILALMA